MVEHVWDKWLRGGTVKRGALVFLALLATVVVSASGTLVWRAATGSSPPPTSPRAIGASGGTDVASDSRGANPAGFWSRWPPGLSLLLPGLGSMSKDTIGESMEGRQIEVVVFGNGGRRLLVVGGIHGDECGSKAAGSLVLWVASRPDLVSEAAEVHILLCANPDGQSRNGRSNARGVDLNRNFPTANWSSHLKSGDHAAIVGSEPGIAPASEPETQALIQYLERGFDAVISLHSVGGFIDYDGEQSHKLATTMSRISGLPVQHLLYQGDITGSLGIYVDEEFDIPMITIELSGPTVDKRLAEAILTTVPQ